MIPLLPPPLTAGRFCARGKTPFSVSSFPCFFGGLDIKLGPLLTPPASYMDVLYLFV